MMNVLLVSNADRLGGAARAAYRLHQGLQQAKVNSHLAVQIKSSSDPSVTATYSPFGTGQVISGMRLALDALPLKAYPQRSKDFSLQWVPNRTVPPNPIVPDIVNLHWTNFGYRSIESAAQFRQPIVWTLHDMWAFTGGCHYAATCDRYQQSCGRCPQLGSDRDWDLSRWVWQRKAKIWKQLDLTIVAPSRWLADCARSSSLFNDVPIEWIPHGIDVQVYQPIDQRIARSLLQLPQDRRLILLGAYGGIADQRKGFHLLQPALEQLANQWSEQADLVVFGSSAPQQSIDLGFKIHYLGTLQDDVSLALVYAAADLFVAPSVQDNLPNTVLEAMACGTPCVAFKIGGMPDLIQHRWNGYLAEPFQLDDLAQGLSWVLEQISNPEPTVRLLGSRCRETVLQNFQQDLQAKRYIKLFEQCLARKNRLNSRFREEA
jgi:glycosyltransferase involved in cell wall biosynthesis